MVREVRALLAAAVLVSWVASLPQEHDKKTGHHMDCGSSTHLCGILVLESGLGQGVYQHKEPNVHGLWPQTGHFSTSGCVKPPNTKSPTKVYPCYASGSDQLGFEQHEWKDHGLCSGTKGCDDYFTQICSLSQAPLKIMATARSQGGDLKAVTKAVVEAGYPIWSDYHNDAQLALTACADSTGTWHIASMKEFQKICGGTGITSDQAEPVVSLQFV